MDKRFCFHLDWITENENRTWITIDIPDLKRERLSGIPYKSNEFVKMLDSVATESENMVRRCLYNKIDLIANECNYLIINKTDEDRVREILTSEGWNEQFIPILP